MNPFIARAEKAEATLLNSCNYYQSLKESYEKAKAERDARAEDMRAVTRRAEQAEAALIAGGYTHNPGAECPWKPPTNLAAAQLRETQAKLEQVAAEFEELRRINGGLCAHHFADTLTIAELREDKAQLAKAEAALSSLEKIRSGYRQAILGLLGVSSLEDLNSLDASIKRDPGDVGSKRLIIEAINAVRRDDTASVYAARKATP